MSGNLMVDASGKVKYSLKPVTKLTCKYDFIKNHKLTLESTPSDCIRPFFPAMKPKGSVKDEFNTNQLATFTNMKAEMGFGGDKSAGGAYDKLKGLLREKSGVTFFCIPSRV